MIEIVIIGTMKNLLTELASDTTMMEKCRIVFLSDEKTIKILI